MSITITEQHRPITSNTRVYDITVRTRDTPFTIMTTVTSNHNTVHAWITNLYIHHHNRQLTIGVTIQSYPLGRHTAATLQLSAGESCLIYQLTHSRFTPELLVDFLLNPDITFVTLDHMTDILLRLAPHNLSMLTHMPMDLRFRTRCPSGRSLENYSVARIARDVLGIYVDEFDMKQCLSNWEAKDLNLDQVKHATIDACVAFGVGVMINVSMFNPNINQPLLGPSRSSSMFRF